MWYVLPLWYSLHLVLMRTVEGVSVRITPEQVIQDYQSAAQSATTSIICDGVPGSTTIKYFTSLKILRQNSKHEASESYTTIASLRPATGAAIPSAAIDIISRQATAKGNYSDQDFSQITLRLDLDTNKITCDDAGQYTCELRFDDSAEKAQEETASQNFTVLNLPSNPVLTGKVNDNPRDAPAASPVLVNVTDVIKLTCAGDIGSDIGAYWDWMKTSDSSVDTMMKFLPLSHSNANEKITDVDGPCTNSRTTVLTYHITETDKNQGDLAFMCSANSTVPLPGGETVYVSSSTFYIHVQGGGGGGKSGPAPSTGDTHSGVIAGAVIGVLALAVIVFLLVYFLWYRRRGEAYKSREETNQTNPG